jgi:hypothetical protein
MNCKNGLMRRKILVEKQTHSEADSDSPQEFEPNLEVPSTIKSSESNAAISTQN